jgi:hypothetical protein
MPTLIRLLGLVVGCLLDETDDGGSFASVTKWPRDKLGLFSNEARTAGGLWLVLGENPAPTGATSISHADRVYVLFYLSQGDNLADGLISGILADR